VVMGDGTSWNFKFRSTLASSKPQCTKTGNDRSLSRARLTLPGGIISGDQCTVLVVALVVRQLPQLRPDHARGSVMNWCLQQQIPEQQACHDIAHSTEPLHT
jgi:hypothetical protein